MSNRYTHKVAKAHGVMFESTDVWNMSKLESSNKLSLTASWRIKVVTMIDMQSPNKKTRHTFQRHC